jgi:GntR family transcriptional regulator
MLFRSNPASAVPVYLQLIEQVKHGIDVGALRAGDQLPTIRRVAEDLVINPNTVAKAYRQLEQEGLVTGRPGQGTFVNATEAAPVSPATYTSLQRGLETWLGRARAAGLDEQAINALFTATLTRARNENIA